MEWDDGHVCIVAAVWWISFGMLRLSGDGVVQVIETGGTRTGRYSRWQCINDDVGRWEANLFDHGSVHAHSVIRFKVALKRLSVMLVAPSLRC